MRQAVPHCDSLSQAVAVEGLSTWALLKHVLPELRFRLQNLRMPEAVEVERNLNSSRVPRLQSSRSNCAAAPVDIRLRPLDA